MVDPLHWKSDPNICTQTTFQSKDGYLVSLRALEGNLGKPAFKTSGCWKRIFVRDLPTSSLAQCGPPWRLPTMIGPSWWLAYWHSRCLHLFPYAGRLSFCPKKARSLQWQFCDKSFSRPNLAQANRCRQLLSGSNSGFIMIIIFSHWLISTTGIFTVSWSSLLFYSLSDPMGTDLTLAFFVSFSFSFFFFFFSFSFRL